MNLNQVKTYVSGVLKGWISNKGTLDKLSESEDGNLLFNGQEIKGGSGSDITISEEANNAIQQKDDGIFVEDKTEQINNIQSKLDNINIAQNYTEEKAFKEDILWEGSCDTDTSIRSINLSKSYQDYDELIFYLDFYDREAVRPLYRIISPTLINKIRNSSISDISASMVLGYGNCGDYCDIQKTSTDTRLDISTYHITLVKVIGRKYNQIVIDPVEHINTSQGIEDAPVGHIISYMGNTAPKHYLICDGTEYNISDYPYLAQHFIDEFGSYNYFGGDGINTFCVPDLRGEFLRGTGTAIRDTGSGANVGEHQDATTHINMTLYNIGSDKLIQTYPKSSGAIPISNYDRLNDNSSLWMNFYQGAMGSYSNAKSTYTSRPTNTSVLYCIKYEPTYYIAFDNYIAQGYEKYSEEEIIIGKWINGKPIYRKYFNFTTGSKSGNQYIMDIPNYSDIERITNFYGTYFHTNSRGTAIYSNINMKDQIQTWIEKGKIAVATLSLYYNSDVHMFIEYTKTTDAENSFTTDMLDTIILNNNDEEITEEQIIEAINIDKTKIQ